MSSRFLKNIFQVQKLRNSSKFLCFSQELRANYSKGVCEEKGKAEENVYFLKLQEDQLNELKKKLAARRDKLQRRIDATNDSIKSVQDEIKREFELERKKAAAKKGK